MSATGGTLATPKQRVVGRLRGTSRRRSGLGRLVAVRLAAVVPVLFLVTLATFLMLELVPGDPAIAILGDSADDAQYERIRDELGLDRPLPARYGEWLSGALHGDLGTTLVPPVRDVTDVIVSRFVVTLQIAVMAMVVSVAISVLLATLSAANDGQRLDQLTKGASSALVSTPGFLLALMLVFAFIFERSTTRALVVAVLALTAVWTTVRAARRPRGERGAGIATAGLLLALAAAAAIWWPELPRQGFVRLSDSRGLLENLRSATLPVLAIAAGEIAIFTQVLRSDLQTTLEEDFVLAARARGMSRRHVLTREALRPSSFSLITVAGVSFGRLLGGTVIVESVFRLPGVGTLMVDAIRAKDYRLVQGGVLVLAAFYVVVNAIVDIAYLFLDPRVRRD